jgi:hypothetical protein
MNSNATQTENENNFLFVLRFEPGSLGWMTDALTISQPLPLHHSLFWFLKQDIWLKIWPTSGKVWAPL